ncbi:MAG: hypothetical protein ACFFD4_31830 [Candidatus Odinarchaeota archaeon]
MDIKKILALVLTTVILASIMVPLLKADITNLNGKEERVTDDKGVDSNLPPINSECYLPEDSSNTMVVINQQQGVVELAGFSIQKPVNNKGIYEDNSPVTYNVNETFTAYNNSISINTNDSYSETAKHQDVLMIKNTNNFNKISGKFEISSITALPDWFIAEDAEGSNHANTTLEGVNGNEMLAQEIRVTVPRVNITTVTVKIGWVSSATYKPEGMLFIVNSTVSGDPDLTKKLSNDIDLYSIYTVSTSQDEFGIESNVTFSPALTLTEGSYYLVLQDTTPPQAKGCYWKWVDQLDSVNGDYGNCKGYKSSTWYNSIQPRDFFLHLETLAVDTSNDTLMYISPESVNLQYNSTSISSTSFLMLLNEYHNFTTNTSVIITGNWECNFTTQSVIPAQSNFIAQNRTLVQWNVTALNNAIVVSDFNVKNHLLNVTGLPNNWNATGVYFNTSTVNCTNYSYTNGSTFLLFNATSNVTSSTWHFVFESLNCIDSLSITGNTAKSFPYSTLVTEELEIVANFKTLTTGGNTSLVVFDPAGIMNYTDTSIPAETTIYWNVSVELTPTIEVNGTYTLEVWWNNDTHAGFFSYEIEVIVTTSLISTPTEFIDISNGTALDLVIQFNNTLNSTGLQGAMVKYNTSWGETGSFVEQSQRGNYTAENIDTSGAPVSFNHNITVNASLEGYEYQEIVIPVSIVINTTMEVLIDSSVIFYTDNSTVTVKYNYTSDGTAIIGATVTVNGSIANNMNDVYKWNYDSDAEGLLGDILLEIVATKDGHKIGTSNLILTVKANPTDTKVSGHRETENLASITNKSEINLYYKDSFVLELQYNDSEHDITVDGTPTIQTSLNFTTTQDITFNWTLIFDINATGYHVVNITFTSFGYHKSLFTVNLSIAEVVTSTDNQGSLPFQVYFNEELSFWIVYKDTVHLENITNALITIEGNCYFTGGNSTGLYTFLFNHSLSSVDDQYVVIRFQSYGYEIETFLASFTVKLQLTEIQTVNELPTETLEARFITGTYTWSTFGGEPIGGAKINLMINGTDRDQFLVTEISPGTYVVNISTSNLKKGWKNFTLTFEKYGYTSYVIQENVLIRGHKIGMIITVPDSFTQGSPLEFSIFLFYNDSGTPVNSNHLSTGNNLVYLSYWWRDTTVTSAFTSDYLLDGPLPNSFLRNAKSQNDVPVIGESVSFEIVLEYDDGTEKTLQDIIVTDYNGIARYRISGTDTRQVISVNRIYAAYSGSEYNEPLEMEYSIPGGSFEFTDVFFIEEVIDLLIALLAIIFVALTTIFTIGFLFLRKRKAKQSRFITSKALWDDSKQRIVDVTSINRIFCRHVDGITFYNESLYGKERDTDAIAGMSTAIGAFIDDVAEQSTVTKGFERMERGKFSMLSFHGQKATITIISTGKVSRFMEKMLENALKEIENIFGQQLDRFFSSDQIPAEEVKEIVRKHLPLGLLGILTVDSENLKYKMKRMPKELRSTMKELSQFKSDLPAPFKVFFMSSLIEKLNRRYEPGMAYYIIEKAYQEGILKDLTKEQLAEAGRSVKDNSIPDRTAKSPTTAVKEKRVLPKAPKGTKKQN